MHNGVPQGSVLGPLLFCIYVRHAPRVPLNCSALLYADDIALCAMAKSLATVFAKLQADLDSLLLYLDERGLVLSPQKPQLLIIRRPKRAMELGLELKCKGEQIVPVQAVKYLGIIVDEHLTFASHVESVCNKAHGKVAIFRHGRRNITTAAQRTFYLSIIQSPLDYASSAYFHCLHTNTYNKILTTSRICMRRIFGLHRCTHFNFVQQKYNLYSIENRANLKLFVFVYRCLNSLTSSLITPIFTPRSVASRTRAVTRDQVNSDLALPPPPSFHPVWLNLYFFSGGRKVEHASS